MSHRPDQEQTTLQKYLRDGRHRDAAQTELTEYLHSVVQLNHEFDFAIKPNPWITQYMQENHPGENLYELMLGTSATNHSPHRPALEASQKAMIKYNAEFHMQANNLVDQINAITDEAQKYQNRYRMLESLSPNQRDTLRLDTLLQLFSETVTVMTPDQTGAVKLEAARRRMSNDVFDCVACRHDESDYRAKIMDCGENELKKMAVDYIRMFCEEILTGKYSGELGLLQQYRLLHEAYAREKEYIEDVAPTVEGARVMEEKLRPQVAKVLERMHGISGEDVCQDNIAVVEGSASELAETALKAMIFKDGRKQPQRKSKKEILLFTHSWDGLKVIAAATKRTVGLIDGGVSAEALEDYIRQHVLEGKNIKDPELARREVKRKVDALIINVPENPSGKMPSEKEMEALAKVIQKYDLNVISDEIFAPPGFRSLITYPGMENRVYVVSGTAKTHPFGGKISYGYTGSASLARRVEDVTSKEMHMHPVIGTGFTELLANTPTDYHQNNENEYRYKRDLVSKTMKRVNKEQHVSDGMDWQHLPDYGCLGVITFPRELTDQCHIENSCQLAEYIFKMTGVKTLQSSDVRPNPKARLGVRINFSDPDEELVEGIERMGVALQVMKDRVQYTDIQGDKYRGPSTKEKASEFFDDMIDNFTVHVFRPGGEGHGYH